MLSKVLAVLALGASSLGLYSPLTIKFGLNPVSPAITINGPNPNAYWVQNTSNVITWSFTSNDPNPIE